MRVSLGLSFLICIVCCSFGQFKDQIKVSGSFADVPLESIFDELSEQTNFFFSYNSDLLPKGSLYTLSAAAMPIDQFLSKLFVGTGITYSFFKDQIILNYEKPEPVVIKKKTLFSISGTVVEENGLPLIGVNIFLDGTSIGTSSDSLGHYQMSEIPQGLYNIVFSHVGYENGVYQISETNGGARIQNHQMVMSIEKLEDVEVNISRIDRSADTWLSNYMIFRREVVGLTSNGDNCVIENPESIDFFFDKKQNKLFAYAQEPIQIRNDALGYRIIYFLESFEKEIDGDLRFRGRMRFRNMEPSSNLEKRAWKNSRKKSYYGSLNHF